MTPLPHEVYLVLAAFGYVVFQMLVVFFLYQKNKLPSTVDVAWPVGLMITGLIYLWPCELGSKNMFVSILLILWAFRLAGYLWINRIKARVVDKRYIELSAHWRLGQTAGFFFHFQFQGLLILAVSSVFLWMNANGDARPNNYEIYFYLMILSSILGESLSDWQLVQFKKKHAGKVCNIGLWNYSRHPNYFFDWMTWLCFGFLSLPANHGIFGLFSPALLYYIFNYVTGPLTEKQSLASHGEEYAAYQKKTPMFFPKTLK